MADLSGEPPWWFGTVFPAWFLFYVLGIDVRARKWDVIICKAKSWWIAAVLGISIAEAFIILNFGGSTQFASSQIKFANFLYGGVIAFVIIKNKNASEISVKNQNGRIKQMLVSVGNCSYGMFYIHILVMIVANKIVSFIGLSSIWALSFMLSFLLTATGSYLFVWVTRKIAQKLRMNNVLSMIGF